MPLSTPALRALCSAGALSLALTLGGCTVAGLAPSSVFSSGSSAAASARAVSSALNPALPKNWDDATAKKLSVKLADNIQALIPAAVLVYVDNHDQPVAATETAGGYYGVLRTITLSPNADPIATAKALVAKLTAAGWTVNDTSNENGTYLTAMSTATDPATSWFIILGGDAATVGQSVVTLQLASPTLP